LVDAPTLTFPDENKKYSVTTDASGTGIGAVLSQQDEEENDRVICYASLNLSKCENEPLVALRKMKDCSTRITG
jgi:hypothetical protein